MEMVEIVKFTLNNALNKSDFLQENTHIDPIYIEVAEYTLLTLQKFYPFSTIFEDFSENNLDEAFKSFVVVWADVFMTEKMSCKKTITHAIKQIIDLGTEYPPTLPQVITAYHGKLEKRDLFYVYEDDFV